MDVLQWPLVGRLLRWRHARTSLQLVLLAAAAVVVLHGLFGPDIAPGNLATVLTWVHYRGLLVVALLAAGNFFCAGCPFVLVRDWGRRLHAPARLWPKRLRGKWIAIVLFVAVLFAYELFDLWALPRGTAYLVLAYFAAALAIDSVFKGATFCKHLCPIGQFNFVASTISPLELRIREEATCQACRTSDCIAGRRSPEAPHKIVQRGCELGSVSAGQSRQHRLHVLPGLRARVPARQHRHCRADAGHRAGRYAPAIRDWPARRPSGHRGALGALRVRRAAERVRDGRPCPSGRAVARRTLGTTSESLVLGCLFVLGLGVAPLLLFGTAAGSRACLAAGTAAASIARVSMRYAYGLVPFGFGMWLAHYGFHLLTGALTVVPVTQSAAIDLMGWAALGDPLWRWAGMRPGAVFPIQLGCILLGTPGSLAVMHLISLRDYPDRSSRATVPWAIVVLLLAATAIWILFQPMEMRGIGLPGEIEVGRPSVLAGRRSLGWPRLRDADLADHRRSVRSLSVESVHSWPIVRVIVWGTL